MSTKRTPLSSGGWITTAAGCEPTPGLIAAAEDAAAHVLAAEQEKSRAPSPVTPEQKVRAWGGDWLDRFYERAGIYMDSGDSRALADQRAYLDLAAERRKEAA